MAKSAKTTTITINGIVYTGRIDLVEALIKSGMLEEATTVAEATVPVLRTDKNGLQWIAKYDETEYRTKSMEMFGSPRPGKAHRAEVYRALGWIL